VELTHAIHDSAWINPTLEAQVLSWRGLANGNLANRWGRYCAHCTGENGGQSLAFGNT